MKKLAWLIYCVFLLSFYANAQEETRIDPRLLEIYEYDYLVDLSMDAPQELEYLNWYLDNSYEITNVDPEKCETLPYLRYYNPQTKTVERNVEDIDPQTFNILLYSTERQQDTQTFYRIGETGKVLVLDSFKGLTDKFNKK